MTYSIRNGYLSYRYTKEDRQNDEAWNSFTKKTGIALKRVAFISMGLLAYYHALFRPIVDFAGIDNAKPVSVEYKTIHDAHTKGIEKGVELFCRDKAGSYILLCDEKNN